MGKQLKNSGLPTTIDSKPSHLFKYWERMDELRIFYEAGVLLALYDALALARDSGFPTPDWVIGAATLMIGGQLYKGISTGSSPTGNTESEHRLNMIHFRRWCEVNTLMNEGATGSIYQKARERLQGQFAHGSSEVIGKSYRRVERDLQKPETALRYYRGLRYGLELTGTAFQSYKVSPFGQKPY